MRSQQPSHTEEVSITPPSTSGSVSSSALVDIDVLPLPIDNAHPHARARLAVVDHTLYLQKKHTTVALKTGLAGDP